MQKEQQNWFASWFDTDYYHILYKDRDYDEAELFMNHLTNYLNIPEGGTILDLACGKGRHSVFLNDLGFDVTGADEVKEVIFGWLTDIEARQELVNIIEFENTVTTFLHISNKNGEILNIVEVFKIDDEGRVFEIWAL